MRTFSKLRLGAPKATAPRDPKTMRTARQALNERAPNILNACTDERSVFRFRLPAALFGAFAVWVLSMMLTTAIGDGRRIEHVERGDEIRGSEVWR